MSKKPSIKISVGTKSGPNSSIWNIIGSKKSNDLYLYVRELMWNRKISLHASGKRIYAFLNNEHADNARERSGFPHPTRKISEWDQPKYEVTSGSDLIHELSIYVPTSDLTTRSHEDFNDVFWITPKPDAEFTVINIYMPSICSGMVIEENLGEYSNCLRVGKGLISYSYGGMSDEVRSRISEIKEDLRQRIKNDFSIHGTDPSWRVLSEPVQVNGGEHRVIYDLSLTL
jgi:hypothetical protein